MRGEIALLLARLIRHHAGVRRLVAPGWRWCWVAVEPWAVAGLGDGSPRRCGAKSGWAHVDPWPAVLG
ncbi:hypothetical protein NDU88_002474 [Pleurodeles waltl]|uniref:Uncharacterized protein n=1 Tax=Pleurodeles waltl TaxID=8319 RepID=A0AAV7KS80_PLEWA|nr:hypothetical protein NDU88_002474 [Pleurodeles waltl]